MARPNEPDDALLTGLTDIAAAMRDVSMRPGQATGDSLRAALDALVNDRSMGIEADTIRFDPDGLVTPVVYAVANHVPLSKGSSEFGFQRTVAAVARKGSFCGPERRPTALVGFNSLMDFDCSLAFFGAAQREAGEDAEARAAELWRERWREYGALTDANERQGLLTWNQFLLTAARRPHVMGAAWNWPDDNSPLSYYVRIDENLLIELGLPSSKAAPCWAEALWDSSTEQTVAPTKQGHAELARLVTRCQKMVPKRGFGVPQAQWALYQLLRSYAIWGGGCFLSIPIAFGGTAITDATSVLSLCTARPLAEREVLQWRFIAREMFQPLIAQESEAVLRQELTNRRYVQSTYGIGHALKNRVMPLRRELGEALAMSDTIELRRSLLVAEQLATSIRDFGHLLNLFGQVRKAGDLGLGALSKDVVVTRDLDLGERLRRLLSTLTPTLGARTHARVSPSDDLSGLKGLVVRPFCHNNKVGGKVRPIDEFYDEVLYELCINAANYGRLETTAGAQDAVRVGISVSDDLGLVVSNEFDRETGRFPKVCRDEWVDWPNEGSDGGGLYYSALALNTTQTGHIKLRITEKDGRSVFNVRLDCVGASRAS